MVPALYIIIIEKTTNNLRHVTHFRVGPIGDEARYNSIEIGFWLGVQSTDISSEVGMVVLYTTIRVFHDHVRIWYEGIMADRPSF